MKILNTAEEFRSFIELHGAVDAYDKIKAHVRELETDVEKRVERQCSYRKLTWYVCLLPWVLLVIGCIIAFFYQINVVEYRSKLAIEHSNSQKQINGERIALNNEKIKFENEKKSQKAKWRQEVEKERAYTETMRRMLIKNGIDPNPDWRKGSPLE